MTDSSIENQPQRPTQPEATPATGTTQEAGQTAPAAEQRFSIFTNLKPEKTTDGTNQPEATTTVDQQAPVEDDSALTQDQKTAKLIKESHFKRIQQLHNLSDEQVDRIRDKFKDIQDAKDIGPLFEYQQKLSLMFARKDEYANNMADWENWVNESPLEAVLEHVYGKVEAPKPDNRVISPTDEDETAVTKPTVSPDVEKPEDDKEASEEDKKKLKNVTQMRHAVQRAQALKQFVQLKKDELALLGVDEKDLDNITEDTLSALDAEAPGEFQAFFDEHFKDKMDDAAFNEESDKTLLQLMKAAGIDYLANGWEDTDGATILRTIFLQNSCQTSGREIFSHRDGDEGKGLDVIGFKDILKWEDNKNNPGQNKDQWMKMCKLMYKHLDEHADLSKWEETDMKDGKRRELLQEFYEKCVEVASDQSRGKKALNKALMDAANDPEEPLDLKKDSISDINKFHFTLELMANMQMLAYSPDHFNRFFS